MNYRRIITKKHLYILKQCSVNIPNIEAKWYATSPSVAAKQVEKFILDSNRNSKQITFILINKDKKEYEYKVDIKINL
jgi:hypothetical protein